MYVLEKESVWDNVMGRHLYSFRQLLVPIKDFLSLFRYKGAQLIQVLGHECFVP